MSVCHVSFQPLVTCPVKYGIAASGLQKTISDLILIKNVICHWRTNRKDLFFLVNTGAAEKQRRCGSGAAGVPQTPWDFLQVKVVPVTVIPSFNARAEHSVSQLMNTATTRPLMEAERQNSMSIPASSACLDVPSREDPITPCRPAIWLEFRERKKTSLSARENTAKKHIQCSH